MKTLLVAAVLLAIFAASPALAAPCKSAGVVNGSIAFPRNDPGDIQLARAMAPTMLPVTVQALPHALSCTRGRVTTPLGDYLLGGENSDPFPRVAMRADATAGPVVYLAASPIPGATAAAGTLALVVSTPDGMASVKRFYAGAPTDRRLIEDVRAALADDAAIMSYDVNLNLVRYGFTPAGGVPPPLGARPAGATGQFAGGPQIMITGGDFSLLDMKGGMKHRPSGFACPQTFEGVAVLLMTVEPQADYLSCRYRAGTDLKYDGSDRMRYRLTLVRAAGQTPSGVLEEMASGARTRLNIKGDRPPPLATGPAPAPQVATFWDTEENGAPEVQGLWVGQAGGWIAEVRAQYPPSPANDAEAGKVAKVLFDEVAKQVK